MKVEQAAEQYIQQQGYSNIEIKVKKYSGSNVVKNVKEYPIENRDFIMEISKKMKEAGFDTKYIQYQTIFKISNENHPIFIVVMPLFCLLLECQHQTGK